MIENSIMRQNRAGKKAVGFGLIFPSMQLVEIAAQCGFDSINVDGEHGHFTPESVDEICRVANGYGMSVTARVPNINSDTINLFLDRGVQGIVGPHIDTVEQAQMLADACLFPPDGQRSWGGGRGTEFGDTEKLDCHGRQTGFREVVQRKHAGVRPDRIEGRLGKPRGNSHRPRAYRNNRRTPRFRRFAGLPRRAGTPGGVGCLAGCRQQDSRFGQTSGFRLLRNHRDQ